MTDDVQLLELTGHDVWLVAGEERNLKMTTAVDVHLATHFMAQAGPHTSTAVAASEPTRSDAAG